MQNILKSILLACLATTFANFAQAQSQSSSAAAPVHVTVDSEVKNLADGYALAFSQLSRPPLTICFQKEGVLRVLEDVKQVRAAGGVLVVEVGRGLMYIINPKDVVYLTDGPQVEAKPKKL